MRWLFFVFLLLCIPSFATSRVLLNEVYYDHVGRDEGFEFIELINPTGEPVDLYEYTLECHDGSSTGWSVVWRGAHGLTIPPGELFLIGGVHVTPSPDVLVELGLQNGPDAVRLTRAGDVVDLLGYGDLEGYGYFETSPAPDVESGFGLARQPDGTDTDDNSADFAASPPSPGEFNIPRHDLEVSPVKTMVADVLDFTFIDHVIFDVRNLGILATVSGLATVSLSDSTEVGVVDEQSVMISQIIEPGESVFVEFDVTLTAGYHWLTGRVVYPLDERPANDTVRLVRRVGPSPVVISEVMSDPAVPCPEFVEIFNSGGEACDLAGTQFRDAAHALELITARPLEMPAFSCIVLTPDADALLGCYPGLSAGVVIELEGTWPSLNGTGSGSFADSVIVADRWGLALDRVAYPPQPTGTKGQSFERVDMFPGTRTHVWSLSRSSAGASPGVILDGAIVEPPRGCVVTAAPNPFDPYGGENVVITVPDGSSVERVAVGIYDTAGRRIADLGSTPAFPAVFVWDGRDGDGRTAGVGLYVVACEFYSEAGGTRRVEKVVVGCARRKQ